MEKRIYQYAKWKAGTVPTNETEDRKSSLVVQWDEPAQLQTQTQNQILLWPFTICEIPGQLTKYREDYFFICETEIMIVQTAVLIKWDNMHSTLGKCLHQSRCSVKASPLISIQHLSTEKDLIWVPNPSFLQRPFVNCQKTDSTGEASILLNTSEIRNGI